MSLNFARWRRRISERSDLSSDLVHLTRGVKTDGVYHTPVDVLVKILTEKRLKGSDPRKSFVHGNSPVVCFQDAPLDSIAEHIAYESWVHAQWNRYSGCGLTFSKGFIYSKGGRPVIYDDPARAKQYLPDTAEHWRIVAFNLTDPARIVDWTHEREWRVPRELNFERTSASVVLDTKASYREFVSKCRNISDANILDELSGIIVLSTLMM